MIRVWQSVWLVFTAEPIRSKMSNDLMLMSLSISIIIIIKI
nr:MAG TPA: hypothetical protein [Caudoviricetes sp.]